MERQALKGLRVSSSSSRSRKEKGPMRPPCSSHSHMPAPAPARTGSPGPAGLPGLKNEKQGREPKELTAGAPFEGYSAAQWRRRRAHPEREPEDQPIRAGISHDRGRSHWIATEAGPGPGLKSQKWLWGYSGVWTAIRLSYSRKGGMQEPLYGCTTARDLNDSFILPSRTLSREPCRGGRF